MLCGPISDVQGRFGCDGIGILRSGVRPAVYVLLEPLIGTLAGILGVVPVLFASILFGVRGGLLIGSSVASVIVLLAILLPSQSFEYWLDHSLWIGSIALMAVGAMAGWLRDLAVPSLLEQARRREAESVLQASEERYRQLVEFSPGAMLVVSQGKIIFVNPSLVSLTGASGTGDLISLPLGDLLNSEDRTSVAIRLHRIGETGEGAHLDDLKIVRPDGTVIDVEATAAPVTYQGEICTEVVVRDITARNQAEKELKESEERFRSTYDHIPLMMHSLDVDGRIESVNQYWLDTLGYETREVIGRRCFEFLTEASRKSSVEIGLPGLARDGFARCVPYQIVKKNGQVIDIEVTAFQEKDSLGELIRSSCFLVDVTERRQSEEDARKLRIEEERNHLSREIHDTLAQSLAEVSIQLEAAGGLISMDPEAARSGIDTARNLAKRSLADVRRTVWDLRRQSVEYVGLAESVLKELSRVEHDGVLTSFKVVGNEPPMDAQNGQAALRIAQEALSNLRRHSQARKATIELTFIRTGVRICIADDGIGFDPAGEVATGPPTGGGFGLTGMQERALLTGGDFCVLSTPGLGTKIEAFVPYETTDEANRALYAPLPDLDSAIDNETPTNEIRVLVVDDHEVVRFGIGNMLEQSDGVVVVGEASDGEEALGKIKRLNPDVVLLDVQMPRLDGIGTLKKMDESGLNVPVILLSVFSKDAYIVDGMRAGASGYLLKDVTRPDLLHAIRTVAQGGSLIQPVVARRLMERFDNPSGPDLTEREMEILESLSAGSSNKDIAAKLSISVRTVQFHVRNLYQKLAVRSRTQAVRVATERRLLQD